MEQSSNHITLSLLANHQIDDILAYRPSFSESQQSSWRVVEVRYHPLGSHGVIVVLENVFPANWSRTSRYVLLNSSALMHFLAININESTSLSPTKRIRHDSRYRNKIICVEVFDQKVRK